MSRSIPAYAFSLLLICSLLVLPSVSFAQVVGGEKANPVPRLMKNLKLDSVNVAASAARSLGVIFAPGGRTGDEVEPVTNLLIEKVSSTLGPDLRRESAIALGRMQAKPAIDALKKAMDDKDVEVAMAAANSVGQILPRDEARAWLIERGSESSETVQAAAYHALAPIVRPEDAPFIVKGLESKNWRVLQGAISSLERAIRLGASVEPEVYDSVAAAFGHETTNASNTAVHFFTHVRNDDSQKALLKAVETRGDGTKSDTTWRNRAFALRAVRHLGWTSMRDALPAVIRQLGDRTTNVTNEARGILIHLRKEKYISNHSLFPMLLVELEKAEPLALRGAIMVEMGYNVDRQYASRVGKIAGKTLEEALQDKTAWVARSRAVILIGASGQTDSLKNVATCVADDVPDVRRAAGTTLEQLAQLATDEQKSEVAPLLLELLVQPVDWRKTAIAAKASGGYAGEESVKPLVRLLSHSVVNVRSGASQAMVRLAGDKELKELVATEVHKELKVTERAWEYGAPVLGALLDPAGLELLQTLLAKGDWRVQMNAANAVADIATAHEIKDTKLSDTLIKVAQSRTLQVQDAANKALRNVSRDDEE